MMFSIASRLRFFLGVRQSPALQSRRWRHAPVSVFNLVNTVEKLDDQLQNGKEGLRQIRHLHKFNAGIGDCRHQNKSSGILDCAFNHFFGYSAVLLHDQRRRHDVDHPGNQLGENKVDLVEKVAHLFSRRKSPYRNAVPIGISVVIGRRPMDRY